MLRTIVGQQVSVASAAAVWNKLEARLGDGCPAEALIATEFDELRACGLSRQKQGYARSLAELILELPERPSEKDIRERAEAWSPHRGAVAIFTWHHYHVMVM